MVTKSLDELFTWAMKIENILSKFYDKHFDCQFPTQLKLLSIDITSQALFL